MSQRIVVLLGVVVAEAGLGQARAEPPVVVRAARMVDVRAGKLVERPVVVVEGGKIVAVGGVAPAGAKVIDLGGATLLPGLIDVHTHIMARIPDGDDGYVVNLATKGMATRALEGAANARATLRAGFTTIRDVESEGAGDADVALREAIRAGLVEGPRILAATRGIAAVGAYHPFGLAPEITGFPTGAQLVSGVEEARRAAREQLGRGADHLKVYADWASPTLSPEELRVIVEEAARQRKKVAAHANSPEAIRAAVEAGVVSIEHGFGADRPVLERMAKKGVALVPTLSVLEGLAAAGGERAEGARRLIAGGRKAVALAREVGVRVLAGSDAGDAKSHGRNAAEIAALGRAGVPAADALRGATLWAAELVGLEAEIGSIDKGKAADLVAVTGDPLADLAALEKVVFVMKGGVVVVGSGR